MCFCDSGGDGSDSGPCDKFDADFSTRIDLFEVVDELGEVFDGVDIVMGRRANEGDAGGGVPEFGDHFGNFESGELTSFSGFCPLSDFDFDFVAVIEVFCGDTESSAGDLFDGTAGVVATFSEGVPFGVFASFAAV